MTSFAPLNGNLSSSLLGVGAVDPVFRSIPRPSEYLWERRVHEGGMPGVSGLAHALILIMISAIIFVTIIAMYDVAKVALSNAFAKEALKDPKSHNKRISIERTVVANAGALNASFTFAASCLVSTIIFIPILISLIPKTKSSKNDMP